MGTALLWLRRDLRLADNPALEAACRHGCVVPVFVHAPGEEGAWPPGGASRWWLHRSLQALDAALRAHGSRLILRRGPTLEALQALIRETGADAVFWNRLYEPALTERDTRIKTRLREAGLRVESFAASLLHEPWQVRTRQGGDYRAFTPFWKAARSLPPPSPPRPLPALARTPPAHWPASETVDAFSLAPTVRWDRGLVARWQPGEDGAAAALERFLDAGLAKYDVDRERPALRGTSRLSPHLHFGEISPGQIWHAVEHRRLAQPGLERGVDVFLSEIGWRDFAHHVLYHHPSFPDEPLNERFRRFPWRRDDGGLERAWRRGETGFPIVDAGMRELWTTGWMHNRVRMIVGSLLVKNLRLPWHSGERWFWDTLVDADLASNSLGWQWVAGSGADAAPFFRIFNPVRQGERFDAEGEYVARWVPELAALPASRRQAPWQASAGELSAAGIRLGRDYPEPVVDLKQTRAEALEAFARIKVGRG